MPRVRPPRTEHEKEQGRLYARRKRRRLMGWPEDRLDDPPRGYGVPKQPRAELPPLVDCPTGHEVYDKARQALKGYERKELGSDMDSGARDLMQEYALAVLEGRDAEARVAELRRAAYRDRMLLVHGADAYTTGLTR